MKVAKAISLLYAVKSPVGPWHYSLADNKTWILALCLLFLLCWHKSWHKSSSTTWDWSEYGTSVRSCWLKGKVLFSKGCTGTACWLYDKRPLPSVPLGAEEPRSSTILFISLFCLLFSFLFGMLEGHLIFLNSLLPFSYKVFIFALAGAMSFSSTCG